MMGHSLDKSSKPETKRLKYWKDNIIVVLDEWWLTIDTAKIEIGNRSKCDLEIKYWSYNVRRYNTEYASEFER